MTAPFNPGNTPGQGQQQQQPHPTVPYGQPGGPATVVLPPNAPMPGFQQAQPQPQPQPQQPQYQQPAPQQPQGTFPQGTQPPYQPQPQQQQQQPQQPEVRIPDNFVLDGPNVPQELRGRTWGQVRQVYGALASEFIARPGAAAAPRPNVPQQPAPQPQMQQPQQPQQNRAPSFWEDPEGSIRRVVDEQLQPVTQRTMQSAAEDARRSAMAEIPDFGVLEAEMIPMLRAAPDARLLTDVNFWKSTADLARGRLMGRGEYQHVQQNQNQNQQPQQGFRQPAPQVVVGYTQQGQPIYGSPNQRGPGVAVPAQQQFFTESPTPPMNGTFLGGNQMNQWELSPEQKLYAQKMGMTEQEYRDWSGGIAPSQQTRRW